ncbi:hypothetical protein ACFIJ5_10455 [Haloimpatiens sp. FM7330]|uniref:hypothetical protein n=1 Tax=Haloimpatiens sp. FM7330 TaxID=3298610 RepID=UPI0036394FD8
MLILLVDMLLDIIIFFIIAQLATVIHQLGHAIIGLIFTNDKVMISLGGDNVKRTFNIGRLNVEIRNFSPFVGFVHCNFRNAKKFEKSLFFLAGPVISFLMAIIIYFSANNIALDSTYISILKVYAGYFFLQGVLTIIPIQYCDMFGVYKGTSSDGYNAFNI